MICFICFVVIAAWLLFFHGVVPLFSLKWIRWNQFYNYNTNEPEKILSCSELRHVRLINLQWDLKSETCLCILDSVFHGRIPLPYCVMLFLNQEYCVSTQYNLLEGYCKKILQQLWAQLKDYSLPGLTKHTRLRIVVHHRCYNSHFFSLMLLLVLFFFPNVSMFFNNSLNNEEPILILYLSLFFYHYFFLLLLLLIIINHIIFLLSKNCLKKKLLLHLLLLFLLSFFFVPTSIIIMFLLMLLSFDMLYFYNVLY